MGNNSREPYCSQDIFSLLDKLTPDLIWGMVKVSPSLKFRCRSKDKTQEISGSYLTYGLSEKRGGSFWFANSALKKRLHGG